MIRRLCLILTISAVAGCSYAPGHGHNAPPDPRPFRGITYFTAADSTALHNAEEVAVRSCMRKQGFSYRIVPAVNHMRSAAVNPYGLLLSDVARVDGYGATGQFVQAGFQESQDSNRELLAAMPAAKKRQWREALIGTDRHRQKMTIPGAGDLFLYTDGCVRSASVQVYGSDWDRLYVTFQALGNQVIQRTENSPEYRRVQRAWGNCMRLAGHAFSTLQGPRQLLQDQLGKAGSNADRLRQIGETELSIARQDLDCERQVKFHEEVEKIQEDVETHVIKGYEPDLEQLRRLRANALKAADQG